MAVPLLTTKLNIPPLRSSLVSRSRLIERLDAGLRPDCRLILLSAPAGFGKTTLLSVWAAHCACAIGWLTLDAGDNDPARFLAYLVAALQRVEESVGHDVLDALQIPQPPSIASILTDLINEVATFPHPFVLILDDYHEIRERSIHDALAFLLDHLPPQMHLILSTRVDPPLPLARLRARDQLTELRLIDLRLTLDEVAEFLRRVLGLELGVDEVAALASRTEGWAAGLQMAGLSMHGQQDIHGFIRAFGGSDRYILDYLVEEVLQQQPEGIRTFLLQTSILDRLSAPLCDAVIGEWAIGELGSGVRPQVGLRSSDLPICRFADSQEILEYLDRANLFLVPLDSRREWYRYHRLFAELLRVRLQRMQPGLVSDLHRRASEWHEQSGLVEAAIEHALSTEDSERAADLIERVAEATLMRAEVATFLGWTERLPDEWVRARPSLCIFHAWALLLAGRPLEEIESRLQDADKSSEQIPGRMAALHALVAAFRAQIPRAVRLSRQALEQLPEGDLFSRSFAAWILGATELSSGDLEIDVQSLNELISTSQETGNLMVTVAALCQVAEESMRQGQLHKAKEHYQRALAAATYRSDRPDRQGQPMPIAAEAFKGLGELAREWNDLDTATHYLEKGIRLGAQWSVVSPLEGYISLARVQYARGDADGAQEAVRKAQEIAIEFDATELDDIVVAMVQARLWIAQGNLDAARRWAEEQGLLERGEGLRPSPELATLEEGDVTVFRRLLKYECLVLARLLIALDCPQQALSVLEPLLPIADRRKRMGLKIEIYVLKALALQAQGEVDRAMTALGRALSLAEPESYVRIFVDEGEPMAQLLYEAAARGIKLEYAGGLLAAYPASDTSPASEEPPREVIEPLSERELEVLQLIAEGLSNREIAQRLVLSLNTVKGHTRKIYEKLGIHSRTQATAKARILGILSSG